MRALRIALPLLAALALPRHALAIRPFITDDARIADPHQLQLETWLLLDKKALEHNALVAFGVNRFFEVTVGGTHGGVHTGTERGYSMAAPVLQLKLLLRPVQSDSWPGFGVSAGGTTPFGFGALTSPGVSGFAYAVATQSIADDLLLVHANLGIIGGDQGRDRARGAGEERLQGVLLAGVGAQLRLVAGLHVVGEIFHGDSFDVLAGYPAGQTGVRYIFGDHVQMDTSFGTSLTRVANDDGARVREVWGTLGLRLVSSPLW